MINLKNTMTIAFGALSLAACSQREAAPGQPFCRSNGDGGAEVVDPVSKTTIFNMADPRESKTNYVWGDAIDANGENTHLGFNVYLAEGEISSCFIGGNDGEGQTFYPARVTPTP